MSEQTKNLVKKLESTKRLAASIDLEAWPLKTRASAALRKRQEEDLIESLRLEYGTYIKTATVLIYPRGPAEKVAKFCEIAVDEFDAISLDANAIYGEIAKAVKPSIGNDNLFSATQGHIVLRELDHFARKFGVWRFTPPNFDGVIAKNIKDDAALVEMVKKSIRDVMKDNMNVFYLGHAIRDEAEKVGYYKDLLPVILTGVSSEEEEGLAQLAADAKKVASVDLTEVNVNKSLVLRTFTAIKTRVAGKAPEGPESQGTETNQ